MRIVGYFLMLFVLVSCATPEDKKQEAELDRKVDLWIQMMGTEKNSQELIKYQIALVQAGEPAFPKVVMALKHLKPQARRGAAFVLGQMQNKKAVPHLEEMLKDEDEGVRYEAAAALVDLKEVLGLHYMILALDHRSSNFRSEANKILVKTTGQDFGFDPAGLEEDRNQARNQWVRWWNQNKDTYSIPKTTLARHKELKEIPEK